LVKGGAVIKSIYANLGGINRRSYVDKAHDLLMNFHQMDGLKVVDAKRVQTSYPTDPI
jgi:hypothetical protein